MPPARCLQQGGARPCGPLRRRRMALWRGVTHEALERGDDRRGLLDGGGRSDDLQARAAVDHERQATRGRRGRGGGS